MTFFKAISTGILTVLLSMPALATDIAIFNNINGGGVSNGPTAATVFSIGSPALITLVQTYHWNGGRGSSTGTITLKHSDGTIYGPWVVTACVSGTLYSCVYPSVTIKAGSYTIIDSNSSTWSYDSASGNAGFANVTGSYVTATNYTITVAASPTAGGSVTCTPNPVSSGANSTCTATANSGYTFTNWSGDCSGSGLTCTLSNVITQKNVTGLFSVQAAQTDNVTIFNNINGGGVSNGPTAATVFSITTPALITSVQTYHWNGGRGSSTGTITFKHSDGTIYGPWVVTPCVSGTLYSCVYPSVTIKAGSYTIIDSNSSTWSYDSASGNAGFANVTGSYVTAALSMPFDVTAHASGSTSSMTLDLDMTISNADVGKSGSIYLGAKMPVSTTKNVWFFNDSTSWVNWTGGGIPAFYTGTLPSSKTFPLLRNTDVSTLANVELYAGYGSDVNDMLNQNHVKLGYTIPNTSPSTSFTGTYIQGDMAGQSAFYTKMVDSLSLTTGALVQAILTVNSFLYTDSSITDIEAFKLRKSEADAALSTLQRYAADTETIIANSGSGRAMSRAALNPDDVLATVASGPSNKQLKTLMTTYKVGAAEAKTILDNAMTGLASQYTKEAEFYDTATRTATLVRDGSGLALTVVGASVAAGGVAGTMGVLDATTTLITGLDGAIKTTKSGLELIMGKDLDTPSGKMGAFITGLSDASELIGIAGMAKWGEKAEKLANIYTIVSKTRDGLQDKVVNIGAHTYDISAGDWTTTAWADLWEKNMPSTLPGTYKIAGVKTVVKELPKSITNVIDRLPPTDKVSGLTIYTVTASAGTGGKISPASATVNSGKTASFTVTPDSGYGIASVTGCGGTLTGNTYVTDQITASCTLSATFKAVATPPTTSCQSPNYIVTSTQPCSAPFNSGAIGSCCILPHTLTGETPIFRMQ